MIVMELTGENTPVGVPGGAVYELALSLGIASQRGRRLSVLVDELVIRAQQREHGDEPPHVRVRAWVSMGHLRVEITDYGIPVFRDDAIVPHELVRLGFAEMLDFQSHGREGNVAECSVAVSEHDLRAHLSDTEEVLSETSPEIHEAEELVVRAMRPDECGAFARLVYRCYGYSYPSEDVYYPERIRALVEEGLMHSAVVFDGDEMVGHASITLARPGARNAEAGKLVVDPRYRSHGLAKKMALLRLERADELGLMGLWTECVSNHPYSQKNQRKLGAIECGIFLGIMTADLSMVGLEGTKTSRGSLVAMYRSLPNAPGRTLYVPSLYRTQLETTIDSLSLERELVEGTPPTAATSRLTVSVLHALNIAVIDVETAGEDLVEQLELRMEELLDLRLSAVYLDLPLSDPGTAHVGEHLTGLGFFYSGLLPESGRVSDVLRLQFLNHEHIQTEEIHLASDWGGEILAMCTADQERVAARLQALHRSA
jgi:serine/threonine-protein kinase RsbW